MDTAAEGMREYQDALRSMDTDPSPLAAQAEALVHVSAAEFDRALAAFHAAADDRS